MFSWFLYKVFAETINTNLPGPYVLSKTGPVGALGNIYLFALGGAGLLALAMISYGGIKWMLSGGNPAKISEAREQITQALLGLLLLFGAYVILNTINPELTVLRIPGLTELPGASSTNSTGGQLCKGATRGLCTLSAQECKNNGTADNPDYKCAVKPGYFYVCRGSGGDVKFCYAPGQKTKGECNTACASAAGAGISCSDLEQNPGCQ